MKPSTSTKSGATATAGNKPNTSVRSSTNVAAAPSPTMSTANVKPPPPPPNILNKCELDNRNVISLADILNSFHAPISEEYAWALTYQCAKCGQAVLSSDEERESCHLVTEAHQLLIHKDGQIHPHTFTSPNPEITLITSSGKGAESSGSGTVRGKGPPRIKSTEECKVISQLALVIYQALDYGMSSDEERPLSADLESLLEAMSSADESAERSETDDEGIERDSGDSDDTDDRSPGGQRSFTFNTIIELCTRRLGSSILSNYNGSGSDAATDSHYKAVCRALVAEALELSSFLQQVSAGTHQLHRHCNNGSRNPPPLPDPELDKLQFTDWARLWVQVIRELRHGVKLKKVDFPPGPPIEYELTPYEILMDDIRSRRYKLNKVMVDGNLPPRIKKDAHAIILEFIRGRPPLKKVTERILGPAPKANTNPIELLMQSIREEHNLRPAHRRRDSARNRARRIQTATAAATANHGDMIDTTTTASHHRRSSTSSVASHSSTSSKSMVQPSPPKHSQMHQPASNQQPQRRLIKADFDFLYSLNTKDDDDEDGLDDSPSGSFFGHIYPEATQSTPASPWKKPSEPQFEKSRVEDLDLRRRHTICNPTSRDEYGSTLISFPFEYTNSLNVFNNLNCSRASPILQRRMAKLPHSMSKSSLQEEFFQSNHWQTAMECLSLNLEEVVHIRNVLTKAELEGLPMDCSLKEDVERGKVCFLCLKTRFGILFGPYSSNCRLCKRTICAKCCSRMRIPMEHFAKVPVSTLSPNLSPREEERSLPGSSANLGPSSAENSLAPNRESFTSTGRKNSVGSAPTSPNTSRKSDAGGDSGSEQRSKSPSHTGTDADEERDRFSPEHTGYGPRSLPTVASISSGLMAWQRRKFGMGKDDKTEKLKGAMMIVCHDCKAMVLEIIRSSRAKKPLGPNNKNLPFLTN